MGSPTYVTKSFTVSGQDGSEVTVSETADRKEVVIIIRQHDNGEPVATARLSGPQFDTLCETKYSLEVATRETGASEADAQ
jgi:hypothetical protein